MILNVTPRAKIQQSVAKKECHLGTERNLRVDVYVVFGESPFLLDVFKDLILLMAEIRLSS